MTILARTIFSSDHDAFRDTARKFFEIEVAPFHNDWEEAGVAPREIWLKAGALGLLCTTLPEEYGGSGADRLFPAILIEEQSRLGLSGPGFSIIHHPISHIIPLIRIDICLTVKIADDSPETIFSPVSSNHTVRI